MTLEWVPTGLEPFTGLSCLLGSELRGKVSTPLNPTAQKAVSGGVSQTMASGDLGASLRPLTPVPQESSPSVSMDGELKPPKIADLTDTQVSDTERLLNSGS